MVGDAQREDDATFFHAPEVADAAAQQVGIGEDQLLSRDAADAGGLDPDVLDRSGHVADDHEVSWDERLVEHDRERREQIAEDVLNGEGNRESTDAEARNQRGDIDPEVVEDEQQDSRPERNTTEEAQRVRRWVLEELPMENEEWALRWRTGRLEDLGFPSWDAAMRVYGFLRPDRLADLPKEEFTLDLGDSSLPVWSSDLPGVRGDERALFRATRELGTEERSAVFYALITLANRIAVADRMELGDPESLPLAIEKATRFTSAGLEFVANENELSLEETLRRVSIERLFRVGANLDRDAALPDPIPVEPEEPLEDQSEDQPE